MNKEEQTSQVKVRLYNLTKSFVYKYQPRYYKQFKGELDDLISQFYLEFLTPKSRVKGKEETLLDKYSPKVTSLEYLVKVSVQRKLIDASRKDKAETSYDALQEVMGPSYLDSIVYANQDESVHVDLVDYDKEQMMKIVDRYDALDEAQKKHIQALYKEQRPAFAPNWKKMFDEVIEFDEEQEVSHKEVLKSLTLTIEYHGQKILSAIQQVTDKTVCAMFGGEIIGINRFTGQGRTKKYADVYLSADSLAQVQQITTFKTGIARADFIERYK